MSHQHRLLPSSAVASSVLAAATDAADQQGYRDALEMLYPHLAAAAAAAASPPSSIGSGVGNVGGSPSVNAKGSISSDNGSNVGGDGPTDAHVVVVPSVEVSSPSSGRKQQQPHHQRSYDNNTTGSSSSSPTPASASSSAAALTLRRKGDDMVWRTLITALVIVGTVIALCLSHALSEQGRVQEVHRRFLAGESSSSADNDKTAAAAAHVAVLPTVSASPLPAVTTAAVPSAAVPTTASAAHHVGDDAPRGVAGGGGGAEVLLSAEGLPSLAALLAVRPTSAGAFAAPAATATAEGLLLTLGPTTAAEAGGGGNAGLLPTLTASAVGEQQQQPPQEGGAVAIVEEEQQPAVVVRKIIVIDRNKNSNNNAANSGAAATTTPSGASGAAAAAAAVEVAGATAAGGVTDAQNGGGTPTNSASASAAVAVPSPLLPTLHNGGGGEGEGEIAHLMKKGNGAAAAGAIARKDEDLILAPARTAAAAAPPPLASGAPPAAAAGEKKKGASRGLQQHIAVHHEDELKIVAAGDGRQNGKNQQIMMNAAAAAANNNNQQQPDDAQRKKEKSRSSSRRVVGAGGSIGGGNGGGSSSSYGGRDKPPPSSVPTDSFSYYILCMVGGMLSAIPGLLVCPIDIVKVRLQSGVYKGGFIGGIRSIFAEAKGEGLRAVLVAAALKGNANKRASDASATEQQQACGGFIIRLLFKFFSVLSAIVHGFCGFFLRFLPFAAQQRLYYLKSSVLRAVGEARRRVAAVVRQRQTAGARSGGSGDYERAVTASSALLPPATPSSSPSPSRGGNVPSAADAAIDDLSFHAANAATAAAASTTSPPGSPSYPSNSSHGSNGSGFPSNSKTVRFLATAAISTLNGVGHLVYFSTQFYNFLTHSGTFLGAFFSVLACGWQPLLIGHALQGAVKYGMYEYCKNAYVGWFPASFVIHNPLVVFMLAAATAEFLADLGMTPFETMKIRLQTCRRSSSSSSSSIVPFRYLFPVLVRQEGVEGLYKTLLPLMCRQVPLTTIKFVAFEKIVKILFSIGVAQHLSSVQVAILAGILAGIICATLTHPADTLVTKIAFLRASSSASSGSQMTVVDVVRMLGFRGVMGGLLPRLLMVALTTGLQWAVYDGFKHATGLPTSGKK